MDPVSIGLILLSVAGTGLSIFSQNKANKQAQQEGELATASLQAENEVQRLNADADYLRLQAESKAKLETQLDNLRTQQQQTKQLTQSALLFAAITLIVLACYQALTKRPRTSINS
nr:hypothetical protein [uncultured Arsenicibacter sp.]